MIFMVIQKIRRESSLLFDYRCKRLMRKTNLTGIALLVKYPKIFVLPHSPLAGVFGILKIFFNANLRIISHKASISNPTIERSTHHDNAHPELRHLNREDFIRYPEGVSGLGEANISQNNGVRLGQNYS